MNRSIASLKSLTETFTDFKHPGQRACTFYANVLATDMGTYTGNWATYDKDGNPVRIGIRGTIEDKPYEVVYDVQEHVVTVDGPK